MDWLVGSTVERFEDPFGGGLCNDLTVGSHAGHERSPQRNDDGYGGFLKWWVSLTTHGVFLLKMIILGV